MGAVELGRDRWEETPFKLDDILAIRVHFQMVH
jgi:hypothetical protein